MNNSNDTQLLSDEELIDRYRKGNSEVLAILYDRYFRKVFFKCFSFTRDRDKANDLTQDILIKTFEHLDSFKGLSLFSTWLYSIANNHCIEYMRKENMFYRVEIEQAAQMSDLEENYIGEENSDPFYHILETIPSKERELLDLKYIQNQSIKDLQEKFHVSASAIKMRLKRARKKAEEVYLQQVSKTI
jgi:RNA polymerase sigma-70 factor (ECF subfamily)